MGQQRVQGRLVKGHKTSRGERLWEMSLEEAPGCSQVGSAVTEQEEMAQLRQGRCGLDIRKTKNKITVRVAGGV